MKVDGSNNGTIAVVALGGNSITRELEEGSIAQQFSNTRRSLLGVLNLIKKGYRLAITHGNGPQVGNNLIRVEESRHLVPPLPLGVIVADLQGGMGYMIQQTLQNKLHLAGINRQVSTILTQVIVDQNDPSVLEPTKFVGPYIKETEIEQVTRERGVEDHADRVAADRQATSAGAQSLGKRLGHGGSGP